MLDVGSRDGERKCFLQHAQLVALSLNSLDGMEPCLVDLLWATS